MKKLQKNDIADDIAGDIADLGPKWATTVHSDNPYDIIYEIIKSGILGSTAVHVNVRHSVHTRLYYFHKKITILGANIRG